MLLYGLACLVVILNIIDVLQTRSILLAYGSEGAANWFMRCAYKCGGFMGMIIFKAALIAFAIAMGLLARSLLVMLVITGMYIYVVIHNWVVIRDDPEINDSTNSD